MAIYAKQDGEWSPLSCVNPGSSRPPFMKINGAWELVRLDAIGSFPLGVYVKQAGAWIQINSFDSDSPDCSP